MKKAIRTFIIGAAMAASVFGTAGAAFAQSTAATQYVQNSMNFRSGASLSGTIIGSVPAGAKVDVLAYAGDWVQVRYNGVTGYIHAGNLADTAPSKTKTTTTSTTAAASSTGSGNTTLQQYMDNTWTSQAQNLNSNTGAWKSVKVSSGYLALRSQPTYEYANEAAQLYNGDTVELMGGQSGSYVYVYSPSTGAYGWVNAGFLV